MSFKFGLNLKSKAINGTTKPAPGKRKPLFGVDDDEVKDKAKVTDGGQEISEFNFEESSASMIDSAKPVPSAKAKGHTPGPPTRKVQAKKEDPSALGNAASIQEAEKRAKEATEVDPTI